MRTNENIITAMIFSVIIRCWTRKKKSSDIWNGIKSDRSHSTTASCALHRPMIARFSLATVNTIESRRTITAFKINVIKPTSVRVMFKCIQTTIAKILQSIKRVFKDIARLKSVLFSIVFSMASVQLTSIVDAVNIRSRTRLIWVSRIRLLSFLH